MLIVGLNWNVFNNQSHLFAELPCTYQVGKDYVNDENK